MTIGDEPMLGFENHLNLFHENRRGLPEPLAHGLAVFLNTTAVDQHFRRFNGHTQVNATDLRQMKYPSRDTLIRLGEWAMRQGELTQALIDARLGFLSEWPPLLRADVISCLPRKAIKAAAAPRPRPATP